MKKKPDVPDVPILVERARFREELESLINHTQLPTFVVADIVAGAANILNGIVEKQYQAQLNEYNIRLKEPAGTEEHNEAGGMIESEEAAE